MEIHSAKPRQASQFPVYNQCSSTWCYVTPGEFRTIGSAGDRGTEGNALDTIFRRGRDGRRGRGGGDGEGSPDHEPDEI